MNISSVRAEDGGSYSCTASNSLGTTSHRGMVNIYGPPSIRRMSNRTILQGDTLVLHCPVTGYPIETIAWEKFNSHSLKSSSSHVTKLPQNHRQTVFPNGTLAVRRAERSSDEGEYRCTAGNKQGQTASRSVHVRVLIPPVLAPILAPPQLKEGQRNVLTCSVLEGDPPVHIEWYKDGYPIKLHQYSQSPHSGSAWNGNTSDKDSNFKNWRIASASEYSSALYMEHISYRDNGNYTCVAANGATSVNVTVPIRVNGKFVTQLSPGPGSVPGL